MSEKSRECLWEDERDSENRLELGNEAIDVLEKINAFLFELGYKFDSDLRNTYLIRISDNKKIALIHSFENEIISVLPILSWD